MVYYNNTQTTYEDVCIGKILYIFFHYSYFNNGLNEQISRSNARRRPQIDMVVAARALAELRLVSVFALIPPTTTTHPP